MNVSEHALLLATERSATFVCMCVHWVRAHKDEINIYLILHRINMYDQQRKITSYDSRKRRRSLAISLHTILERIPFIPIPDIYTRDMIRDCMQTQTDK